MREVPYISDDSILAHRSRMSFGIKILVHCAVMNPNVGAMWFAILNLMLARFNL